MKQNIMINTPIVIFKWWKSSKCKRNKILIILIQCTVIVVVGGSDFWLYVKSNFWSAAVAQKGGLQSEIYMNKKNCTQHKIVWQKNMGAAPVPWYCSVDGQLTYLSTSAQAGPGNESILLNYII